MFFAPQHKINPTKIGVKPGSVPSAVVFKGKIYLFYSGYNDDGIFSVVYDKTKWLPQVQNLNTSLSISTSPCAVSAFGSIYLFFNSASNDGIRYITSEDGQHWTTPSSVNVRLGFLVPSTPYTSPSAVNHLGKLYLFWNRGNALQYATVSQSQDGFTWKGPVEVVGPTLRLVPKTSCNAVDFGNKLYLFYNGSGYDGTFVTTLSSSNWSPILPLTAARRVIPNNDTSSPATFTFDSYNGRKLGAMWNAFGTIHGTGLFYDSTNGYEWSDHPSLLSYQSLGLQLLPNTIPASTIYQGRPFIFWVGASDTSSFATLYFSHGERPGDFEPTIDVDSGDFSNAQQALLAGRDFKMQSKDVATLLYFQSRLETNTPAIYAPDSRDYASAFKLLLGSDPTRVPAIVAGIISVVIACLIRGYDVEFHFLWIVDRIGGCTLRSWAPITNGQRSRL